MKKAISLCMTLVLLCAVSISAFAATGYTKEELITKINATGGGASAAQKADAINVVNAMTTAGAAQVDAEAVKAEAKMLKSKMDAGTATPADVEATAKAISTAAGPELTLNVKDVTVDTASGVITAKLSATIGNTVIVDKAVSIDVKPDPAPPVVNNPAVVIKSTGTAVGTVFAVAALSIVAVL
ncbi:MAG: hypothetical protein RSF90_04120, partial [Pygmaiobacter sp.]